jgi:hypothetical protein
MYGHKNGIFFILFLSSTNKCVMDKELKNRSGSQSNGNGKAENKGDRKRTSLPGAPSKSNRQTGGHERDDSSRGADRNTTKKGANSI